jgi:hypothetical protein
VLCFVEQGLRVGVSEVCAVFPRKLSKRIWPDNLKRTDILLQNVRNPEVFSDYRSRHLTEKHSVSAQGSIIAVAILGREAIIFDPRRKIIQQTMRNIIGQAKDY